MRTLKPSATPDEARVYLGLILEPGETIYSVIRHVSASGTTRHISFHRVAGGELHNITAKVAATLGYHITQDGPVALVVRGAGMDMAFHVVYQLGSAVLDDGYALRSQII